MQIIRFAFSDDVLDDIVNGCSPSLWLICKQMKVQLILLLPLTQITHAVANALYSRTVFAKQLPISYGVRMTRTILLNLHLSTPAH